MAPLSAISITFPTAILPGLRQVADELSYKAAVSFPPRPLKTNFYSGNQTFSCRIALENPNSPSRTALTELSAWNLHRADCLSYVRQQTDDLKFTHRKRQTESQSKPDRNVSRRDKEEENEQHATWWYLAEIAAGQPVSRQRRGIQSWS